MNEDYIKKLVLARLESMPEHIQVNMGGDYGALNKADLINHVKNKDELGKKIIEMQMAYLRSLKDF